MKTRLSSRNIELNHTHLTLAAVIATAFVVVPLAWRTASRTNVSHESAAQIPSSRLAKTNLPAAEVSKLSFIRGDFVYLKDLASGKETKVVKGKEAEVSPDGSKLVIRSGNFNDAADPSRLKLLDLTTNHIQEFPSLAGLDAYNAHWSHDGAKIAFEGPGSGFSVFNPATGAWKIVTRSETLQTTAYEAPFRLSSWAPDDESIIIHSLEYLYQVKLNGEVMWKLPVDEFNISSETTFSFSNDNRYLLFDSMIDNPDRPINEVLSILEIGTKNITTITPATVEARQPLWFTSGTKILFTCMPRNERDCRTSLCKINLDGKDLARVVEDASRASLAR